MDEKGEYFCSRCADTIDKDAEKCSECGNQLKDQIIEVRICPLCGCPVKSEEEYEKFKEKILEEPISMEELRWILSVLDNLLKDLPKDKIEEFAQSENFELYKKILDTFDV